MLIKDRILKLGLISLLLLAIAGCSTDSDPLAKDDGSPTFRAHASSLPLLTSSENNLWIMLGKDMHLKHYADRADVQEQIQWYMSHTDYLERTANRAAPYAYYILQQIKKRNMPAEIALLPIIESAYNPFAHSGAGAAGLWQIMPSTAIGFSLRENWWYDGRRDFYAATPAALDYLEYLSTLFHGDWLLAIAAYNSGEGTVNAAIHYNHKHDQPTDFWNLKLPEQTRQYVPSLLALAIIMADPEEYPVNWPPTKVEPTVAAVQIDGQIDLAKAAQMASISVEEIYYLNPGYTRLATDPTGDHMLIIPADKVKNFNQNLANLPKSERVSWDAYQVKLYDTLEKIAKKFRTTPKVIQQVNNLPSKTLQPGSTLLLPKSQITQSNDVVNTATKYAMANRSVAPPEPETYTVKAHDTLKSIARQFKVDIRNLLFWNQLKAKDKLTPGISIIIQPHTKPVHQTVTATSSKKQVAPADELTPSLLVRDRPTETVSNGELLRVKIYEVQPGDTVIRIAHKFGVNAKALKAYNDLNTNLLHVGQILKIPSQ
ncbi:MAG: LysM peptidoglycan-binding domain-containing protein [Gammaproteobacteria bacterium]|nr:LysM peptidoglycan-binding domain-containing protein [Gammaproteobacteria bacterium]